MQGRLGSGCVSPGRLPAELLREAGVGWNQQGQQLPARPAEHVVHHAKVAFGLEQGTWQSRT